jgi:hypothetical protein
MTNIDPAPFGGTPTSCKHQAAGYCRKCTSPLYCLILGPSVAVQFSDALSCVTYARANYDAVKAAR